MTDDITTALEELKAIIKEHPMCDNCWYSGPEALSTIETELARLREMAENAGRVRDKNYERRLEAEAERDEAIAALRVTPHVGGRPGQTHQSHPNVLACHACAVLARLHKEPTDG